MDDSHHQRGHRAHSRPTGHFVPLDSENNREDYSRRPSRMHRWLCCSCQVEESNPMHDEPLKSPKNNGGQKASKVVVAPPVKADAQKPVPTIEVPALSIEELKDKTDNFSSKALIGEGYYGRVYFATLDDSKVVAIKKLDVSPEPEPNIKFLTQAKRVFKVHNQVMCLTGCKEYGLLLRLQED